MATSAKQLRLDPIDGAVARRFIAAHHYSGTNAGSQYLYLGVFDGKALVGAMSWGRAIDIRNANTILEGAKWKSILELGRLAMVNETPPNSESRMLGVAVREIARRYPHVELLQSYADATQCGDGTIYRASGFLLMQVKPNGQIWEKDGHRIFRITFTKFETLAGQQSMLRRLGLDSSHPERASTAVLASAGYKLLPGFQLRYVKPLRPGVRERLTLPVLPYSEIDRLGAGMYLGRPKDSSEPSDRPVRRGRGSTDPDAPNCTTQEADHD